MSLLSAFGCGSDGPPRRTMPDDVGPRAPEGERCADNGEVGEDAYVEAVFFAQTHVSQPSDEYFGLTADRSALIKAHVTGPEGTPAPSVVALLRRGDQVLEVCLTGPDMLPTSAPNAPGRVDHTTDNTYTGIIPAAWVQPGLTVGVLAGPDAVLFEDMRVGAPSRVVMTMVDVHFFAPVDDADYPTGWEEEFANNWPVRSMVLRRSPPVVFPEVILPPDCSNERPPTRRGADDWDDGEQSTAQVWMNALRRAAGRRGRWSLYYVNIYGVASGGQAGGYGGVGNGRSLGILNHELGHAMGLPHWGNSMNYPYRGTMFGIPAPEVFNDVHVGPVWAYDQATGHFLTPVVGPNSVGGDLGTYKKDPMQGGGQGDQEAGYLMRPFSDFSVSRMRSFLEGHVIEWNDDLSSWASWNADDASYTNTIESDGVAVPVVRDAEVISVLATTSERTPDVDIVYPPIGPYTAALIDRFDPEVEAERTRAAEVFCPDEGCDVSVRVTQGGTTSVYMLPVARRTDVEPCAGESWGTAAVNLPAGDGAVTHVELLSTPDAETNGLGAAAVLASWDAG